VILRAIDERTHIPLITAIHNHQRESAPVFIIRRLIKSQIKDIFPRMTKSLNDDYATIYAIFDGGRSRGRLHTTGLLLVVHNLPGVRRAFKDRLASNELRPDQGLFHSIRPAP
jgi:hypothetical protein